MTETESSSATCESVSADSTSSLAAQQASGTCIVGAGLAGIATAAALDRIASVKHMIIVDQLDATEWTCATSGAAVQLGPNGLRALLAIENGKNNNNNVDESEKKNQREEQSILKTILTKGTIIQKYIFITNDPSNPCMTIPDTTERDTGLPQVLIRWAVLRDALLDLAGFRPSSNNRNTRIALKNGIRDIIGYQPMFKQGNDQSKRVQIVRSSCTDNEPSEFPSAPLIIGADGLHTTFGALVRRKQKEHDRDGSNFLARTNGKEVLPSADSEDWKARNMGIVDGGRTNVKAVVSCDLWKEIGAKYDIVKNGGPGTTFSYFTPNGGVACFAGPAGDGYTYWSISILDEDKESKINCISNAKSKAEVKFKLLEKLKGSEAADRCNFVIELIEKTDSSVFYVARSQEREIGGSLVSDDGLVVLVGDAAHAMSPAYGQGANFAMEDAATLAVSIRDGKTLLDSLHAFSSARRERCIEMQRRSAERTAKASRGEQAEDISKWIFQWKIS